MILSDTPDENQERAKNTTSEKLTRLDLNESLMEKIRPLCRLKRGEIWEDPLHGHRVGVLDGTDSDDVQKIAGDMKCDLIINDPPYNIAVGGKKTRSLSKVNLEEYMDFSKNWVDAAISIMKNDSHFFIWLGADYRDSFQPLPDFMIMMRDFDSVKAKNYITLRNQRGYGTQKNWMWIRQELLHYVKGNPDFTVTYTDIPKVLKGYYKVVKGKVTDNMERSKSDTIRPGNVWIDVQQVFYRMEENVPGCYAQKPLKAIDRIIENCSSEGDLIVDFFAHAGTTLIAGERMKRRVFTFDIEPVYAEITIRRLENYREKGKTGFQWFHPFPEIE